MFGFPGTYPAENHANLVQISGFDTPDAKASGTWDIPVTFEKPSMRLVAGTSASYLRTVAEVLTPVHAPMLSSVTSRLRPVSLKK